jgi:hypothetical protein
MVGYQFRIARDHQPVKPTVLDEVTTQFYPLIPDIPKGFIEGSFEELLHYLLDFPAVFR